MESVSLSFPLFLLLLTTTLGVREYRALASSYQQTADVEQFVKSCQAQAAEQAQSLRAQLKAAHAKYDSEVRAHAALRHEKSALENRCGELRVERDRSQRESRYLSSANNTLKEKLKTAEETASDVETASRIRSQWFSISDPLEKAGFVASSPEPEFFGRVSKTAMHCRRFVCEVEV